MRIGLTIAKTLAWSLKIPLHLVSSLQVLAANEQGLTDLFVRLWMPAVAQLLLVCMKVVV
ncbi:hypothetical protein [Planococcus faecalis]|uniref:hypothetical protein n=1 Tax=Planococcus faecalis TaxID=1598147 RepID=UPI0034E96FA7